jgi:NHL repeat-containing protein
MMKSFAVALITGLTLASWAGGAQSPDLVPTITTYAGPSLPVNGGPAITQAIENPTSVISDGAGGFYFASGSHNKIYRVSSSGTLTFAVGTGRTGFTGDGGPATSATLAYPVSMALDANGNLFIADHRNHRVRKVSPAGIITTVGG